MSIDPELQAASDALLANLDRLRALEEEKRTLPLGSPRLVELAEEIERLAAVVLHTTDVQEDQARLTHTLVQAGEAAADETIQTMTPSRDVHAVLADWRDAERRLLEYPPDSDEASRLRAQVDIFKMEYRRALDAATKRGRESG